MVAKKSSQNPRGSQRPQRTAEGQFAPRPAQESRESRAPESREQDSSCSRTGVTAASLIGGLGVGAALMYLLDPEAGQRRREMLRETAADAIGTAGETLGSAWETASEK